MEVCILIFVTGDTHGSLARFEDKKQMGVLMRGDYLIVCGDFGFIWDGGRREERMLNTLAKQKYTILFVDGCHENYDRLYQYPVREWNGGKVRFIKPNIIHLCRGQVFTIENRTIFTMGGGVSEDYEIRQSRGTRWWPEETPTTEEMREAVNNLYKHDLMVDFIITHEPPTHVKSLLVEGVIDIANAATLFFDELSKQVKYKHWFFGFTHKDKHISGLHTAVFNNVLPLEKPTKVW